MALRMAMRGSPWRLEAMATGASLNFLVQSPELISPKQGT
jgi:hypothetical protein